MGQFSNLLNKITAPDPQPIQNPAIVIDPKVQKTKEVNLGVKIPLEHRAYWTSKAKAENITIKSVIIAALIERFGHPPE